MLEAIVVATGSCKNLTTANEDTRRANDNATTARETQSVSRIVFILLYYYRIITQEKNYSYIFKYVKMIFKFNFNPLLMSHGNAPYPV